MNVSLMFVFSGNFQFETGLFAKVARLEDRRSELCMSTLEIFTKGGRFWGRMPPYPAPSGSLLVLGR